MTDRIHVTMTVDLFVEDESAMRDAAFERMREAWSSEDDFPFDSAGDVPLDQVIHSVLADALPAELPGCRRSQLEVESESDSDSDSGRSSDESTDSSDTSDDEDNEGDNGGGDGHDDQQKDPSNDGHDESTSDDTSEDDDGHQKDS